ncbi:protein PSK SIMULATOR 1-like [Aristolochia californica]|uniref:protein PSK SIMULATOR 1-like n=1 Tax=Aristolochia californica TaxID=171875 RepID=UPI0035D98A51
MVATKMIWLSSISSRVGNSLFRRPHQTTTKATLKAKTKNSPIIGILAFETAKTMSRLVSLYKSLSDAEIQKLREDVIQSEGVHYLNSVDPGFLLHLACAEKIEDLDRISLMVSRLGKKCREPTLQGFDSIYSDLKLGFFDFAGLVFSAKEFGRKIAKMEKLITATGELYSTLENLSPMEGPERRLLSWKSFSGPMQVEQPDWQFYEEKLAFERDNVRRIRENSLWSKSFDKVVALMARAICNVFERICDVFGPDVSGFHPLEAEGEVLTKAEYLQTVPRQPPMVYTSGPLEKTSVEKPVVSSRNSGPITVQSRTETKELSFFLGSVYSTPSKNAGVVRPRVEPGENTLEAAALALRYAHIIDVAEKLLNNPNSVDAELRDNLYQMLPTGLRATIREKMRRASKSEDFGDSDESLAEGWREGIGRILGWLAPMAQDTLRWKWERQLEQQLFESRPMVLLLQTLFYSDREKAEAAIAEVLVGLSCICRHLRGREMKLVAVP